MITNLIYNQLTNLDKNGPAVNRTRTSSDLENIKVAINANALIPCKGSILPLDYGPLLS